MNTKRKSLLLLISLLLIITVTLGGIIAFITTHTGSITNTFTAPAVGTEIKEDFDQSVKSNVTVKNTGDVTSYIRATIIVNWVDDEGNVSAEVPKLDTDYSMTLAAGTGWVQYDGYYYYTSHVDKGGSTGILISEAKQLANKEGRKLQITILAEAIQASPADAVHEAWGVDISDGNVTDWTPSGE